MVSGTQAPQITIILMPFVIILTKKANAIELYAETKDHTYLLGDEQQGGEVSNSLGLSPHILKSDNNLVSFFT